MKKGAEMEELPVKIKGGRYVSKCENYGVFVVHCLGGFVRGLHFQFPL